MSIFRPIKINKPNKVHYAEYIRTEHKPGEDGATTKPAETAGPIAPASK